MDAGGSARWRLTVADVSPKDGMSAEASGVGVARVAPSCAYVKPRMPC